jgi:hypothetical protein
MAKTSSLVLLVSSLTKAEKRYFKLYSSIQSGSKNYMVLFDIICQVSDIPDIKAEFQKKLPGASYEVTSKYLYELLMDALVYLKSKDNDETIKMNQTLSVIKVLFERSLTTEALSELQKLKNFASKRGNNVIMLNALLIETEYIRKLNFADVAEKDLIDHQMQVASAIKSVGYAQQHTALYELIKHRMIHKGNARTAKQKDELNDLVVSEMSIIGHSSMNNFEAKKTHLLFQSTYCMIVGDYRSALATFSELNLLFENNRDAWKNTVTDYLECLAGILDSLQTIGRYKEMDEYLLKIENVPDSHNENALLKLRLIFIYKSAALLNEGLFDEGIKLIEELRDELIDKASVLSFDKQSAIHLHVALIHLSSGRPQHVVKYLNRVLLDYAFFHHSSEYKTLRLIRLLAQYELNNVDMIDYEVKALKRQLSSATKTYKLEKLMFKFLQQPLQHMSQKSRVALWNKIKPEFDELYSDRFEIRIVNIFNFSAWAEAKVLKKSLSKILEQRKVS